MSILNKKLCTKLTDPKGIVPVSSGCLMIQLLSPKLFCLFPGLKGSQKPYCENQWPSKPVIKEEATRWGGVRVKRCSTNNARPDPRHLIQPEVYGEDWGKASKNIAHLIPPKQTSRATQIFQLECWKRAGNGSVQSCPSHPTTKQCWLWGEEGQLIHIDLQFLHLRLDLLA